MVEASQYFADSHGCYDITPQAAIYREASDSHLLLGEWGRGFDTEDDNITSLNAIHHGLVWACINVIAGDLGQIPLCVMRKTEEGYEKAENHPISQLLSVRPNKYQTPASFIEYVSSQVEVWGNAFVEIVRDPTGKITSLVPIPSRYMNYETDENGEPFYYMYSPLPGRQLITYELDEVLHFKGLESNGFWGYRLVEIAFPELRLARANLRHASSSYANGAIPGGVLQHPGKPDKDARMNMRNDWNNAHGGSKNRGKIAVLWEGMTYNAVAASAHDSQLMESIAHNPRLIGMLFQLAPYKLGDWSESSTRANLEDSQKEYFQSTLSRRLNKMVQEINYKLFPMASRKFCVKPDPTELLKGDKKTQMETASIGMSATLWTRNEARAYIGMNAVDGGDEFVNPNTTANAGQQQDGDEDGDQEDADDTQDLARRMERLLLTQAKVVCQIERDKVAAKQKTKNPTANVRQHYNAAFGHYASEKLLPTVEAMDGILPLVPLDKAIDRYADVARTRAVGTAAADWNLDDNAALLASFLLGKDCNENA